MTTGQFAVFRVTTWIVTKLFRLDHSTFEDKSIYPRVAHELAVIKRIPISWSSRASER